MLNKELSNSYILITFHFIYLFVWHDLYIKLSDDYKKFCNLIGWEQAS